MPSTKINVISGSVKMHTPLCSLSYFFLITQMCFGINFGFCRFVNRRHRFFFKYFTSTISVVYVIFLLIPVAAAYKYFWFWFNVFEYTSYLVVLKQGPYNLHKFVAETSPMVKIKAKDKIIIYFISIFQTFVMTSFKGFLMLTNCLYGKYAYCVNFNVPTYVTIIYCIPILGIDIVSVGQLTIFYYIYLCARNLKEDLRMGLSLHVIGKNYIKIGDLYDKVRPLSDNLLILELCVGIPKMMATIWDLLNCIKIKTKWFTYVNQVTFAAHNALQILIMTIFSEMVQSQVDGMKLMLHEQLMIGLDERKTCLIVRILRYIEIRRLQNPVCRFIPTDVRLVLSLFNLCVTYLIVVIQFTHLYD